ncbi:MAG: anti-sigma factor [Caulobacteraceae bacterium]
MSSHEPGQGEEPDVLAGELALGVLDGQELQAAEHRAATDPGFSSDVDAWQARLAGLVDEVRAEPAPAHIWARIVRALGETANIVELRLRRSLVRWRAATAAAAAIAAVLAIALVMPRPEPLQAPLQMAKLSSAQGPAVFVAMFDPVRRQVVLAPISVTAAPGRSPELWLIPTGGKPIALGVAAFEKAVQFSPRIKPTGEGALLAVSIEPEGGSPTGQPTGPVVATGKLQAL